MKVCDSEHRNGPVLHINRIPVLLQKIYELFIWTNETVDSKPMSVE